MKADWKKTGSQLGFPDLAKYDVIAYDTETTGLKYPTDKVFGFSLATPEGKSGYYDIREQPEAVTWINKQFANFKGTIVCHNASFDYRMSLSTGIFLPLDQLDDTAIRACCLDEHEGTIFPWTKGKPGGYSLDFLSEKYLGATKYAEIYPELAELFGGNATRKAQMPNLWRAPSEMVAKYAIPDAELTMDLWNDQQIKIWKRGLKDITEFERKLMPTIIRSETRGVRIDVDYAEQAYDKLGGIVSTEETKLFKMAGKEFNPNSPMQVRELFNITEKEGDFFSRDGTKLERTGAGKPSLGAKVLDKMSDPLAKQLSEYRSLLKTRETFLSKQLLGNVINGRVYPNINQMKGEDGGTGTGRLSYTSPALQTIPNRNKKVARLIKPAFLPEEGQLWMEADMASFEVRIFAHLVSRQNNAVAKAYANDPHLDMHQWVADLVGLPRNASKSGQAYAKQLNLSMLFNTGKGSAADQMGMAWEWDEFKDKKGEIIRYKKPGDEALALIEKYHRHVPGVLELAQSCKKEAEDRGFIETAHGRRLRFPRGYKSYKASAVYIQATAADENKENWLRTEEALGQDGTLILNTHDSYSMSVNENWEPVWKRVKGAVERQTLRVPLLLDFEGVGKNWAEAKGL